MSEDWYREVTSLRDVVREIQDFRVVAVPWRLMPSEDFFGWERAITWQMETLGISVTVAHANYAQSSVIFRTDLRTDPCWILSVIYTPPSDVRPRFFTRGAVRRLLDLFRRAGSAALDLNGFPPAHFGRGRPR